MTTQNSRTKSFIQLAGLIITIGILSQCIAPLTLPLSRWIAAHSVYIMLGYFGLGALALVAKRPYLMLTCWMTTVALCHFLKDADANPFYYSPTQIEQTTFQVAHFNIKGQEDQQRLFQQLSNLDADLISIQSARDIDFEKQLFKNLELCYPYQHHLHYQDQQAHSSYVFSRLPLEDTDSFHCEGVPYINGFVRLDSNLQQRIQFISLHIPNTTQESSSSILDRLDALADKCALHKSKEDAFMAFSAIPVHSWSPEIRAFRTRFTLNDSRLDLDLWRNNEHIFYSDQLRCTGFRSIENGVIGSYQFSNHYLAEQRSLSTPSIFYGLSSR